MIAILDTNLLYDNERPDPEVLCSENIHNLLEIKMLHLCFDQSIKRAIMRKMFFVFSCVFVLMVSTQAYCQNLNSNEALIMINSSGIFPSLTGENLNEKKFILPQDLPAEITLVLIAFEREQAEVLESWSKGLDLPNSQIPWIETPVISTPYVLGGFFIDRGMRIGIPDPKIRERVITLYTDRAAFAKSMGFEYDKHSAYVAVVDRSGKNLGMVKGPYDDVKARALLKLLEAK
jgi:hypothetical protein